MLPEKALKSIAAQCSRRELSRYDVITKLQKWELEERDIKLIVEKLERKKFVDDRRYALAFARDKFRFKKWGRTKIEQQLRLKQIAEVFIKEALAELEGDDYAATCRQLLEQKNRLLKEDDPYKRKIKLIRFAVGRGFDYETAYRSADQVLNSESD